MINFILNNHHMILIINNLNRYILQVITKLMSNQSLKSHYKEIIIISITEPMNRLAIRLRRTDKSHGYYLQGIRLGS